MIFAAPLILLVLAASPASAEPPGAARCDVAGVPTMPELQGRLSRRAVEAIGLAATAGSDDDPALMTLVAPEAEISLGAGDVGRPLGTGPAALRVMAREMQADSFRFLGWNFMPMPAEDPCGRQEVEVEFIDSQRKTVFPVTFIFEGGRIVEANGWSLSYEAGPVAKAAP